MKTHRMSRNVETRNGHKAMAARGRASILRGALLDPDLVLTGRRFRRANKMAPSAVTQLTELLRQAARSTDRPTASAEIDERTGLITGWRLTS